MDDVSNENDDIDVDGDDEVNSRRCMRRLMTRMVMMMVMVIKVGKTFEEVDVVFIK